LGAGGLPAHGALWSSSRCPNPVLHILLSTSAPPLVLPIYYYSYSSAAFHPLRLLPFLSLTPTLNPRSLSTLPVISHISILPAVPRELDPYPPSPIYDYPYAFCNRLPRSFCAFLFTLAPQRWSSWEVASGYDSASRPPSTLSVIPQEQQPPTPQAATFGATLSPASNTADMDDDARDGSGQNLLRPLSQPTTLASRFPSLRRINSTEPYRHRSLPAEPSPGSDRASSEITFAVLYDDGPDYHVGHMDDRGSMHSGHQRPDSAASYAPSFHTRDSEHFADRNPDFVSNQRLLAEGYLNSNDSSYENSGPRYPTQSEETLALNTLHNSYSNNEKRLSSQTPIMESNHSRDSWCTCDEDHGHSMPVDRKDPGHLDLEAQNGPPTPTPFLSDKKAGNQFEVCIAILLLQDAF
jgi:hypothetical protein